MDGALILDPLPQSQKIYGKHIVCQYFRWKFSVSKRDVDKYSPFLIFDKDDRHEINQIADVLVLYLLVLNAEFFSLILHL